MFSFWRKRPGTIVKFGSLHEAVDAGDLTATQALLRDGIDPNLQSDSGATPLHIAAARGHVDIAKLLIESGANVNFLIDEGGTPLMAAAARIKPRMIELLISCGAKPNMKGHDGRFPLVCLFQPSVLAVEAQLECIRLMVDHGAIVDERTDDGITPLMSAAWFGNLEAVRELLRLGADVALRNNDGKTPAMLAFQRGHDTLAHILK